MITLYVATEGSLLVARETADGWVVDRRMEARRVEGVSADPNRPTWAYAAVPGLGVCRTQDGGETWSPTNAGLATTQVYAVAVSPHDARIVFCGTEPSAVHRSDTAGDEWRECPGLSELPSAGTWSFPPRPETHHVRWITPDPVKAQRIYVCVEAGALLRSEDGGRTWRDRVEDGPRDTHTLAAHRKAPGLLVAAAGDGYAESQDGGDSWERPVDGLEHHYVWSVALDALDPGLRVISAAQGPRQAHDAPTAESFVYRRDGERPWRRVQAGLPEPTGTLATSLAAHPREGDVFFAANNHGLFRSDDGAGSWRRLEVPWPDAYVSQRITGLAVAVE